MRYLAYIDPQRPESYPFCAATQASTILDAANSFQDKLPHYFLDITSIRYSPGSPVMLNDREGFEWAILLPCRTSAKICISGESMRVSDCKEKRGIITGYIDNAALFTDKHGLALFDEVTFIPTNEE